MPNVVSIQLTSGPNVQANLLVVSKYLKEISQKKTKLVVLPENFALMPEHDAEYLVHAETEGEGPIQEFVSEHAKKYKLWIIVHNLLKLYVFLFLNYQFYIFCIVHLNSTLNQDIYL